MIKFSERDGVLIFTVRVVPRASKSEIVGEHDGALKIRLNAAPVDGAANEELIKLLARIFDVSKNDIKILSGATSKTKQVRLFGANADKLLKI
jgi:uncharacterized protein (TIGR00251 family)